VLAKAGQTLSVSVSSTATGIAFQVYPPEATLAKGADGVALVTGRALPDAGPGDNAKAWIGAIPRDGNYLILVAMSGAGGSAATPYSLAVSLQ
jgi:electron transfer flavoprotein alpha/beta subunit